MTRSLIAFVAVLTIGLSGVTSQCSNLEIESSWDGNYKAVFKTEAPYDYEGVILMMTFSAKVDSIEIWSMTVVSHDDTHFTFESETMSGSAGDSISVDMIVHHSGPQPLAIEITMNGEDACGGGGGFTTEPPFDNPCPPSGSVGIYDYEQALCMTVLFYEAQRSGALPPNQRVTWRHDSALGDGSDVGKDLSGGYYDAGDHVKFGFPMAFTATSLAWGLSQYEVAYEAAGTLEYARDAVKWATDYFLKAHTSESELYGQVGNGGIDHAYWGRPEDMTMDRPSAKIDSTAPGSDLAGETAAALAAASIVFKEVDPDYSAECLAAAKELYTFADEHRAVYSDSIQDAGAYYRSWSGYEDELVWGAAWLAKATGEEEYLAKAKKYFKEFNLAGGASQYSWDDKKAGVYALLSELDGGSEYKTELANFLSKIINEGTFTPGGMVYLDQWGSLRHAANVAYIAFRASDMGIETKSNINFAKSQIDYILGSNGRSFIVGFGEDPHNDPIIDQVRAPLPQPPVPTDGPRISQDLTLTCCTVPL